MTKSSGKKKEPELSEVLKKWLEPRIRPKLQQGLSYSDAWEDIVKDIVIKALSPLPLNVFASSIQRLQGLDDTARLAMIERLLTISPNPECAPPDRAERIRNTLLTILSPQNAPPENGTSFEIDEDFWNMTQTVFKHSHKDWSNARDIIERFIKECASKYDANRNVYIVFPRMTNFTHEVFEDIHEQKCLARFYGCMQELAAAKGYKLLDLIKPNVSKFDEVYLEKFVKLVFPKGLPDDPEIEDPRNRIRHKKKPKHKFSLRPRRDHSKPPTQGGPPTRPRWHNQQQMLLRTLMAESTHILPRTELITRAIELDAEMSEREGLPRCFTGQTPRNSASACLTTNADKYFVPVKQDGSQSAYYKLSFIPGDLDSAIKAYNKWMKQLIEHDWPLCFGKAKENIHGNDDDSDLGDPTATEPSMRQRNEDELGFCGLINNETDENNITGTKLIKSPRAIVLSTGASNEKHLRCRRCGPETKSCDMKLPSCTKCKTKGLLCVYPMRAGVHRKSGRQLRNLLTKTSSEPASPTDSLQLSDPTGEFSQSTDSPEETELSPEPTASSAPANGRNLRTKPRQITVDYVDKKPKKVSKPREDSAELASREEIMKGLDLTGVPTSLQDIVEVCPSTIPNAGRGLFAKRNLPMSTPLGFYFGVPTLEHEFDLTKDHVGKASHYSMRYRHTILDATDKNGEPFTEPDGKIFCPFHFMNEDPFGNMVFLEGSEVNQVICWTKRDIQRGEELFVYYGGEVDRGHWGNSEGKTEEETEEDGSSEELFEEENGEEDAEEEKTSTESEPQEVVGRKRKRPNNSSWGGSRNGTRSSSRNSNRNGSRRRGNK